MTIFIRIFMMIGLAFLLVGCGATDDERHADKNERFLNEAESEKVFTEFNSVIDEVDVYDVDMQLVVEQNEGDHNDIQKAQMFGTLEASMENLEMTAIDVQGENKKEVHIYKAADDVYLKNNDAKWVKEKEENNEYSDEDTSYENVAHAIARIKDNLDLVEAKNTYKATYSGDGNQEIFNAFEQPFSLLLTDIDIEQEAEMDLLITINKESKFIEDIQFKILAETDGVDQKLTVNLGYDKINTAAVGIPVEVMEEAEAK